MSHLLFHAFWINIAYIPSISSIKPTHHQRCKTYGFPHLETDLRGPPPDGFRANSNDEWLITPPVGDPVLKEKLAATRKKNGGSTVETAEIPNNHRLDGAETPINNGIFTISTG